MDKIEEEGLFKLTNFQSHPTNERYIVFQYADNDTAFEFEELLKKNNIEFEKSEPDSSDSRYYFGVHKSDFKRAQKLNFIAFGKYRKPFIGNNIFKWLLLLFTLGIITLAIIGALKQV